MPIRWLRTALRNLEDHASYIAEDNPDAARRAVERVRSAVIRLAEYPNMGRIGRVPETRELVVPGTPWVVVYRIRNSVEIIRVLHSSQAWPPQR
jgi:toxin ParE1/3/4